MYGYKVDMMLRFDSIAKEQKWDNNRYRMELFGFLSPREKNYMMELCKDINNVPTLLINCLDTCNDFTMKYFKYDVIKFNNDMITLHDNLDPNNVIPKSADLDPLAN